MTIHPIQGRLLVELRSAYKNFSATEERFGTSKTQGVVRGIAADIAKECEDLGVKVGSMVYFGKYEDSAPYKINNVDHTLIKLEEISGYSEPEEASA